MPILRPWWRLHATGTSERLEGWQLRRQTLLDHFAQVAGLLLLLCALLWAVEEHSRHKAALRGAETGRYIAAFQAPPVADAWRRLSETWHAQEARQRVLLRRIARLSGAPLHTELANYRAFVIETVAEHDLAPDIDTVIRFYRRLAVCIRIGSCDASLAAGRFGTAAWSFRNQHYYYLRDEYEVDEIDGIIDVIAPRMVEHDGAS